MNNQGKYPKQIEDFFKNKESYKKVSSFDVKELGAPDYVEPHTFEYYSISDEVDLEECMDAGGDLAEIFYGSYDELTRNHFRENFVPLISEVFDEEFLPTVLGVYLDEENFPVYVIGERTGFEKIQISESIDSFVTNIFKND